MLGVKKKKLESIKQREKKKGKDCGCLFKKEFMKWW